MAASRTAAIAFLVAASAAAFDCPAHAHEGSVTYKGQRCPSGVTWPDFEMCVHPAERNGVRRRARRMLADAPCLVFAAQTP